MDLDVGNLKQFLKGKEADVQVCTSLASETHLMHQTNAFKLQGFQFEYLPNM